MLDQSRQQSIFIKFDRGREGFHFLAILDLFDNCIPIFLVCIVKRGGDANIVCQENSCLRIQDFSNLRYSATFGFVLAVLRTLLFQICLHLCVKLLGIAAVITDGKQSVHFQRFSNFSNF